MIINTESKNLVKLMASTVAEAIDQIAPDVMTETGTYLTALLVDLVSQKERIDMDRPLCLWMSEAQSLGIYTKYLHCRAIGDTAIVKTGLFRPRMAHSPVSPSYYLGFGRSAYKQAAVLQRYFHMDSVRVDELECVSSEIERASDILAHVGARLFPRDEEDLLVHYEHAIDIKSEYSRQTLLDCGILTVDAPLGKILC